MSATLRHRQQRLFTGALFPEALNEQLAAFALRHRLQSNVWVPRRAFDSALQPYNVFILPNAALCDVSFTPGGGAGDVTAAIGTDRVLVNAQHTSNQKLMEDFRDFLTTRLAPPAPYSVPLRTSFFAAAPALPELASTKLTHELDRDDQSNSVAHGHFFERPFREREYFTAADQNTAGVLGSRPDCGGSALIPPPNRILQPDPQWDGLPPFQHPLALNGSLLLGTEVSARLLAWMRVRHVCTNYWRRLRSGSGRHQHFTHVSNTEYPGRYNPFFCARYVPHNYTGRGFPADTARLMRHRAVEYGYVSRMWLTLRQGQELFGTSLRADHARDFPTVYSTFHTGGLECLAYYCADQFERSEEIFPTRREIDLAAKGVWVPSSKIAAFPLLWQLQQKYNTETTPANGSGRRGTDVAMQDATRHSEFCQRTETSNEIQLVGFDRAKATKYLQNTHLVRTLLRQCILCGYPTPTFLSHRNLVKLELRLRDGEEGVVQQRTPVPLPYDYAWLNGECWFNVAQLQEPTIGAELVERWPRHFLTRRRLHGPLAVHCCRLQVRARTGAADPSAPAEDVSAEWVPLYAVQLAGWTLREGAAGVRYRPYSTDATFKRFVVASNILFRIEDVQLEPHAVAWMRRYAPVDVEGRPFLRGVRQLLTLRAYERGYQSPVWLSFHETASAAARPPLRTTMRPPRAGARPLDCTAHSFKEPPFVHFRSLVFVNEEEVVRRVPRPSNMESVTAAADMTKEDINDTAAGSDSLRDPDEALHRLSEKARGLVEEGVGVSAEAFLTHKARASEQRDSATTREFFRDDGAARSEDGAAGEEHGEDGDLQPAEEAFVDDYTNDDFGAEEVGDLFYEGDPVDGA